VKPSWRGTAMRLAEAAKALPAESRHEFVVNWLRNASTVRAAIRKAERIVAERHRIAKHPKDRTLELVEENALQAQLHKTGRSKRTELTEVEEREIETAVNATTARIEFLKSQTVLHAVDLMQAIWSAAAFVVLSRFNWNREPEWWDDRFLFVGMYGGQGKATLQLNIAAMALDELGYSTSDIHRALKLSGVRTLKDRAQIRRMKQS